jgi:hypothetical protein
LSDATLTAMRAAGGSANYDAGTAMLNAFDIAKRVVLDVEPMP